MRVRLLEIEADRLRYKGDARAAGSVVRPLARFELHARLLTVAKRIVGAERNLLTIRQKEFLAALHQVLLIEGPGIHEVLQHDHEDIAGKGAKVQASQSIR